MMPRDLLEAPPMPKACDEGTFMHLGRVIALSKARDAIWAERVRAALGMERGAVVYPPDGTVSPFTVINLGSGKVKMGDAIHDGRLPALWFGKDGLGVGVVEDMNRAAAEGETLAVVTFSDVEGLDVLLEVVQRIRGLAFPDAAQPAASTVELSDDRMPQALQTDAIVEMNVAMLRQRSALGIEKYGTTLADSKLPLNAWLQHALEETLDNANYLQAAIQSNASRLTAGMAHSVDVAAQNAAQRLGRALLAKQAAQSPVVGRDAVDAARYRWLEQQHEGGDDSFCVFRPSGNRLVPIGSMTGELATAIDAAINSKEG